MTAQEKIIFTYPCIDADDGKEVPPSIVLAELRKMLPQVSITRHLSRPYPYLKLQQDIPSTPPPKDLVIDVRHLRLLARHPIEFYLQRSLGIYFENSSSPLLVSNYDLAHLRREARGRNVEELIARMEKKGKLPPAPFKEIAVRKISEEIQHHQEALKMLGVEDLFSVDMRMGCDAPVKKEEWIVPPVQIPLPNGKTATIVGKISDLTSKGLLVQGANKYPDLLRVWPLLLVLHHLPLNIPPHLLLTEDGAHKPSLFAEPTRSLGRYIEYYLQALAAPSPFFPRLAKNILSGEEVKMEDDPIVDWFLDHFTWPDVKGWAPLLREVFDAEI